MISKMNYDEKTDTLKFLSNVIDTNNFFSQNNIVRGDARVYNNLYTKNDIIKM